MIPLVFHEAGYKFVRSVISQLNHVINDDYEPVVTLGQQLMTLCKIPSLYTNYSQNLASLNINRSVFSLEFASPVTFAAFESHLDSLLLWLNLGCGGGCLKTIKIAPELGNDRPRIQQVKLNNEWHLMNALG
jgi:hypothetical protein